MASEGDTFAGFTCNYAIFINTLPQGVDAVNHISANGNAIGNIPPTSNIPQTHHTAVFYNAQIHKFIITHSSLATAAPENPNSLQKRWQKIRENPLVTFLTIFSVGIALWAIVLSLKANQLAEIAVERADVSIALQRVANDWAALAISWAYWSYNATIVGNRISLMGFCEQSPNASGCVAVNAWSDKLGYLETGLVENLDPDKDVVSEPNSTSVPSAGESPQVPPQLGKVIDTPGGIAVTTVGAISAVALLTIFVLL